MHFYPCAYGFSSVSSCHPSFECLFQPNLRRCYAYSPCLALPCLALLGLTLSACSDSISSIDVESLGADAVVAAPLNGTIRTSDDTTDGVQHFVHLPLHKRLAESTSGLVFNGDYKQDLFETEDVGTLSELLYNFVDNAGFRTIEVTASSSIRFCPPGWNSLEHSVEATIFNSSGGTSAAFGLDAVFTSSGVASSTIEAEFLIEPFMSNIVSSDHFYEMSPRAELTHRPLVETISTSR